MDFPPFPHVLWPRRLRIFINKLLCPYPLPGFAKEDPQRLEGWMKVRLGLYPPAPFPATTAAFHLRHGPRGTTLPYSLFFPDSGNPFRPTGGNAFSAWLDVECPSSLTMFPGQEKPHRSLEMVFSITIHLQLQRLWVSLWA